MPDLSELKSMTRSVTVDFFGVPIEVQYRPAAMTVELEERLFAGAPEGEDARSWVLAGFQQVIAGWDVTEGGEPVPITAEGLRQVPSRVLWETLVQIGRDQSPGKSGGNP